MKEKETVVDCDVKPTNNCVKQKIKSEKKVHEKVKNSKCSNDILVEVKVNEYVKKGELTTLDIRALVVRCTSCGCQINHLMNKAVLRHRKLRVITCRDCYEFYGSSEFSQDESGYNYCTWCGNGGKLIVCDFCPNGFCNACIRRNFGRAEISVTNKEGWKCYCCNKTRLEPKVNFCDVILDYDVASVKKEKKPPATEKKNKLSEKWLDDAFNGCDSSSKLFHQKLGKLKKIGFTKSKSLKHVVKKMEEVINSHKSELKKIIKQVTEQYKIFIESERRAEEERIAKERSLKNATVVKEDTENEPANVAKNESNREDVDCIIIGDDTPVKESEAEVNETIQAKLSLLQSSSDSDFQDEASSKPDPLISCKNGDAKDAKRTLDFELSDSKSGSESSKNEKLNISEICESLFEENGELETAPISAENDPKLKLQSRVDIFRCDTVFKIEDGSVQLSDDCDEEKLDKLIDSLCKSPIKRVKRQCHRGNAGPKCKKVPQPVKPVVEGSSSSISLSTDDERGKIEIPEHKINDLKKSSLDAKATLMNSDSSDISLGSEVEMEEEEEEEEEENKKKKSKPSRKKETDSSDDFVPRKKKKYNKLLHGPLLSDDEKKSKSIKERKMSKKRVLSSEDEGKEKSSKKNNSTTDSSSEEELRNQSKDKKKRKRIKKIADSSSDENKDENADGQAGKGRKNIKKIISQKKLATTTKEAQLEEKERKKRIEERQKLYNQVVDTSLDGKQVITKKMVLEFDHDTKKVVVEIHPDLVCKLKPHQVNGVKFMWECTIETVKDLKDPGSGCILAHCMGLGKTLQVITFLHTCLMNSVVGKTIRRAMVICPYNTALNWASEFDFWLHDVEGDIKVHQLAIAKSNFERLDILQYWFDEGGVLITSYDIFRRLGTGNKIPKLKPRERKILVECLLDPGPDIVVCDEGHVLKNEASAISKATSKLRTRRRVVLTGTPLQNNLKEYHCMLSFVKPNLLGTVKEFRNRFVNPIMNGQYDDSNEFDVKLMKKRIHILHKLLDGCVQRCDYSALTKFLPPKHEFVISVKLSEVQMKMYECYLERIALKKKDAKTVGSTLFIDFNNLRCIWNHPYMCIESQKKSDYKRMMADDDDEDEMADFIVDGSESSKSTSSNSNSGEDSDEVVKLYKTRSRQNKDGSDVEEIVDAPEEMKQWFHEFISDEDKCNIQLSGKMVLLMDILTECEAIGDKIIVFSQSLLTLNAIEEILHHSETLPVSEKDKDRDIIGRWIKGLDYFRMDGGTNLSFRKSYIDMFNNPLNDRARLFLISTKAGGLGTNLVGANRVIVFDTSWNPSHDVQAIFRVYRFGQTKPVYIYRFLAQGTMEEKIYDRQVTKLSLSCRVVDEQQIDRHFSAADLAELYTFDRNSTSNRPTPLVPKDRLLAEMLINNKNWIVTYHEHDSLLQSQTEEDLTEEERQAAWTEYENEREGREPPSTFDDSMDFAREPDFTSMDYEGKLIPDIQSIIVKIFEHLKGQMPGVVNTVEFKKKLLASVLKVRQVFQEKHVKILRMKQEYVAHGTVPNAVNKYMDELSHALKSTGEYITRLKVAIAQEEAKLKQQWQENLKKMQEAGIRRNCEQEEWRKQIFNLMNAQSQAAFRARMPQHTPQSFSSRAFSFQNQRPAFNLHTYSRPKAKPVITEADENASETVSTSSKQPTIIEVDEEPAAQSNETRTTTVTIEEID